MTVSPPIMPESAPEVQPNRAELITLCNRAVGHALSLIGGYQACDRPKLIEHIRSLDLAGLQWVVTADAQMLRMMFLPASPGTETLLDWVK